MAAGNAIVVFVSASSGLEATRIAEALVNENLAACVNIIADARSIYRWQGKVQHETEHLLIIKTRREAFAALETRVRALHTYETPEVIAVDIVAGSEKYLAWIRDSTDRETKGPEDLP